jgi:hypothetical protein
MPGITAPIAEAAGDVLGKVYNAMSESKAGRGGIEALWSMARSFVGHPEGETVWKMVEDGVATRQQALDPLMKPIHDFQSAVRKDSNLARMHDYSKAPLAQIHGSLRSSGHSAAATLAPLMSDSANHTLTIPQLEGKFQSQANFAGRTAAFGKNAENLAATIYPMLKSSNPLDVSRANAWLGIAAEVFKDTEDIPGAGLRSGIKADVRTYVSRMEKQYGSGLNIAKGMKVSPEWTPPDKYGVEKTAGAYAINYLAPGIAVVHLSDFFKLATLPAQVLMKTFTSMGDKELRELKWASGIFNHTMHSIYHNDFMYRTGRLARMTGLPDASAIIQKLYHTPLFNNERMTQLSIMGSAAYHATQLWAKQAVHGDARAIQQLKELHFDVPSLIRRNGELTEDELKNAIFNFTNNRLFIDKPLYRSKLSQSSPFFRIALMFHGYISRESQYIVHELSKGMRANDYAGLAQFVATIGLLYPAAAPMIDSLGVLLRTGSPSDAYDRLKQDYGSLIEPKGFGDFASTYLKLIAHFGGAGVFTNYLHAVVNHRTAAAFLGPAPGVAAGFGDDIGTALHTRQKAGDHNLEPLQRDFLHYATIPILGSWVSHYTLPTRAEKGSTSSVLTRRLGSHRHERRR